jgi:hypothetical protein
VRQLCNAAYAAMTEWADEKKVKEIDRELAAEDPSAVSHGTQELMALIGAGGRQR